MKLLRLVLILCLLVPAALAAGKSYKFDLDLEGIVAGKNLRSGTYRIEVKCTEEGRGTVSFYDGSRLAAQVPCNMVDHAEGSDSNAVGYTVNSAGKRVVSTIYIKGAKEKIVVQSGN
jgi:hypothetical protein